MKSIFNPKFYFMKAPQTQADLDNHANQLNPNNDEYWHSRE